MEIPSIEEMAEVVQVRTSLHGRMLEHQEAMQLSAKVSEASSAYGVPPALVLAVIEVESSWNRKAVSSANCLGLMQVHPNTAAEVVAAYGLPKATDNVVIGTAYLSSMFGMFRRWDHALMAFNKGPGKFREQKLEVGMYARKVLKRYRMLSKMLRPRMFQS